MGVRDDARRGILSVRLFQVVEVLHQLFVVHAEVEVVQFDRVAATAGVLAGLLLVSLLLLLLRRGDGRGMIEREHWIPDDRGSFHVHRSPVAARRRLHEQRVRVSLRRLRRIVVVVDTVAVGRRRSTTATSCATQCPKINVRQTTSRTAIHDRPSPLVSATAAYYSLF